MNELIDDRRTLHRHPEAGFTEFFATSLVVRRLMQYGYEVHWGREIYETERMGPPDAERLAAAKARALILGVPPEDLAVMEGGYTGAIARLKKGEGPVIALRFDMDCVEVQEDHPMCSYASDTPGLMHACGHDGHTAVGLSLAKRLAKAPFEGTLLLIFQPAEEGVRGGAVLSQSALLKDVDYFIAGHLGITGGEKDLLIPSISESMNTAKWDVEIQGESVHAALYPEKGIHALRAAADLVCSLYELPPPQGGQSRLNVGTFHSGTGRNVVPDRAYLQLETRGSTPMVHDQLVEDLDELCRLIADRHGVRLKKTLVGRALYSEPSPYLIETARLFCTEAGLLLDDTPRPMMGSEDAFHFIHEIKKHGGQGIYLLFGTHIDAPHHHARFDFNEGILEKMVVFYQGFTRHLFQTTPALF
ncbi:hypothetical protein ABB02_00585 [Clostridiaceae bacterium JG1575]|nr:hypothetical protein ABB02_00585 [Clostridiaceae bacterium JG1575]